MAHGKSGTRVIPDKLYFKIGEVSEIVGVDPHVLRYWESEFSVIRPQRASSKQRLYRKMDIENILKIQDLLYGRGFTIAGAKKVLRDEIQGTMKSVAKTSAVAIDKQVIEDLKKELIDIKELLERK